MIEKRHINVLVKFLIKLILLVCITIFFLIIFRIKLNKQNSSDFINLIMTDSEIEPYEVELNTYSYQDEYKNIMIEYPSLKTDFSDFKIETINEMIKKEALKLDTEYNYVY